MKSLSFFAQSLLSSDYLDPRHNKDALHYNSSKQSSTTIMNDALSLNFSITTKLMFDRVCVIVAF